MLDTEPEAKSSPTVKDGEMKLQEYLETLWRKYEAYFDIYPDYSILDRRLDLYACSHVRDEKFCAT